VFGNELQIKVIFSTKIRNRTRFLFHL